MITPTAFEVNIDLLSKALSLAKSDEFKTTINQPTGNFFYDPWKILTEYEGTVFEEILNSLDFPIGEARVIVLKPGQCYLSHADIDDRFHLNISGKNSFLVNLDTNMMYPQTADGVWYAMDAGCHHSAVNFGYEERVQLVVRKLLTSHTLVNPVSVDIKPIGKKPRYEFDEEFSPWLNRLNKEGFITEFSALDTGVRFKLDKTKISDLNSFSKDKFLITIL